MNNTARWAALLAMLWCALLAMAETQVYVLHLDDEIDGTTWRYTRQALNRADEINADLLVVHLNTYGGALVEADSIRTALLKFQRPTVAFVDHNAASAGALIALACDTVFMSKGSSMGAATVVDGTGGALPDKYQSYMRSMMRSTAEHHGKVFDATDSAWHWRRDPLIAEAMVDSRIVVPGLIDSTKVLTFTPVEAIKYGYADGYAENVQQVLKNLDIKEYKIDNYQPTLTDKLLGFLGSAGVQAVLIMFIVGGIYFELQSPGMGFPSAAALVAAILYFMPMYAAGTLPGWILLVFIFGIVLFALELFVIPGFGVCGIAGALCILVSLAAAIVHRESLTGFDAGAWAHAIVVVLAGVAGAAVLIWFLLSRFGPKIVRRTTMLEHEMRRDDGYVGVDLQPATKVGATGVAVTVLRPAGKIEIEGTVYDAVADTGYIEAGTEVVVTQYSTSSLHVKPCKA